VKKVSTFWVMFAGTFTYLLAVTNRSSLGVAALLATERFEVNAAALSTLAVSQLAVYAFMQVPVGILLDRYGAKKLLVFGSIAMAFGQLLVSVSQTLSLAVMGRMLVGLGDAFVFISVIRLVNGWYEGGKATRVQQLVTNIGQLGQAVSAIPFALLLQFSGWQVSFFTLAALSGVTIFVGLVFIKNDRQEHEHNQRPNEIKIVLGYLKENLRHPGVRMAFWVHFTLQSAPSVFSLLWGYPFMVQAVGQSPQMASLLLSSFVIVGFFIGPLVSSYCARYPVRRSLWVLGSGGAVFVIWSIIILLPGTPSLPLIIALCIVLAAAGPSSMIAFDYARTFVPKQKLGTASGVVNVGGFVATFSMMFIAGLVLDIVKVNRESAGASVELYSIEGFKWAMLVQLAVIILGISMFLLERRKARIKLFHDEGIKLRPIRVVLRDRIRGKIR